MSLQVKLGDQPPHAELIGTGEGLAADLVAAVKQIFSDPARTATFSYELYDYTGVVQFQMGQRDVYELYEVEWVAAQARPDLVLCIAAPDNLLASLERLWGAHAPFKKTWTIQVFHVRAEADAWLKTR